MSKERYSLFTDGFAAFVWTLLFMGLVSASMSRCRMKQDLSHIIELLEPPPAVLDAK